jgi:hypothetical protein
MGRKKVSAPEAEGAGAENISQYWKNFFTSHSDLLAVRSNDEAIAQWKADHPGQDYSRSVNNGLTNVKSQMRKEHGVKSGKRRRGRPRKHARAEAAVAAPAARVAKAPTKVLEALEDGIDKCLHLISGQEGLGKIAQTLKHARRLTILQIGE